MNVSAPATTPVGPVVWPTQFNKIDAEHVGWLGIPGDRRDPPSYIGVGASVSAVHPALLPQALTAAAELSRGNRLAVAVTYSEGGYSLRKLREDSVQTGRENGFHLSELHGPLRLNVVDPDVAAIVDGTAQYINPAWSRH